jgi:hypothetical protein
MVIMSGSISLSAQPRTDTLLQRLFSQGSPALLHILQYPDSFRYQLIYTQIDRDAKNRPHFKHYYLHVDPDQYFNPASTVKMPIAFLALEKLNDLHKQGLDKYTPMRIDSVEHDIAYYLKQIFLVSDNDAYNRLYEFLGQQAIHEKLWEKGYPRTRIVRRFMPLDEEGNRNTPAVSFGNIYSQPPARSTLNFDFSKNIEIGHGHWDQHDSLIMTPMDFTKHNNVPLEDLQQMLQSVIFPASVPRKQRFHLTTNDYRFLYTYMSAYPSEVANPHYDTATYFDSYVKFFLFKDKKQRPPSYIRIFNKPGWSYGFLTDVAYIIDTKNKVEFMLSATLYVNRDGILNDDKYEYEEVGYPFFRETGEIIYQYELQRKRKYQPDLSSFKMTYEKGR